MYLSPLLLAPSEKKGRGVSIQDRQEKKSLAFMEFRIKSGCNQNTIMIFKILLWTTLKNQAAVGLRGGYQVLLHDDGGPSLNVLQKM